MEDASTPAVVERIAELDDAQAVQALALFAYKGRIPQPATAQQRQGLAEAASDPTLSDEIPVTDEGEVSEAQLARVTLVALAETPEHTSDVERAVALALEERESERFDPTALIVGGLVLVALQTEVEFGTDDTGKWRFRIHKRHMSDSTLGKVLGKLVSLYGGGA